jgi:folate-binding protein YgfZ
MPVMNDVIPDIPFDVIDAFPYDLIEMRGNDTVDFLQRMSTNDFSRFSPDSVEKTLFITDKGRMIDAVWVFHNKEYLVMAVSKGKAEEIIHWLNRYIIMEDIVLKNITGGHTVAIHFTDHGPNSGYPGDYFSFPVHFELNMNIVPRQNAFPLQFDLWRVRNGIPVAGKEIIQDFNPLELHLRDWISFTKGCYIGQEIIARLDTYKKVQRALYHFSTPVNVSEQEMLMDNNGMAAGKITSVVRNGSIIDGLAVIRTKDSLKQCIVTIQSDDRDILLNPIIRKGGYGRN